MGGMKPESAVRTPESPVIILEIADREGGTPLRVPVAVQNLTAGVVTLEVIYSQSSLGWENLNGRTGNLRLRFKGGEEPIDMQGKLVWTRFAEVGRQLTLGLELAKPTLTARKILGDLIPHTAKDIKGLWNRWDQVHADSAAPAPEHSVYGLGMALLFGGVFCQLLGSNTLQLFGWVLWFFGSLVVAGKSLWSILHRISPAKK